MRTGDLTEQGKALVELYKEMAENGYALSNGGTVSNAYNDFELKKFRELVVPHFATFGIETVLDYGSGGSNWEEAGFDSASGTSAKDFFNVKQIRKFEPARGLTDKVKSDCVVCMDVLEHVFLADITSIVRDLFSLSKKLLVVNVACYHADALLPNGENAHITVREPSWWKGIFDALAGDFPATSVLLICSTSYDSGVIYDLYGANQWSTADRFSIEQVEMKFGNSSAASKAISLTTDQVFEAVDLLTKKAPETIPKLASVLTNNIEVRSPN